MYFGKIGSGWKQCFKITKLILISLRGQNPPVLFTKLENRFLQTNDIKP